MPRHIARVFISLFFIIAASGAGLAGTAAQEPGALVNGVSVCPPNLEGASINAADCAEPAANVGFYAANPNTDNVAFGDTGGDGLVSFPLDRFAINPDGATVEVGVIAGSDPYGEIAGYAVSCTNNGEAMDLSYVSSEVQPGGSTLGVQFTIVPGDQVACEWYLSHAGDETPAPPSGGETPAPPSGGPVTSLPTTGTGSAGGGSDAVLPVGLSLLVLAAGLAALVASRWERTGER
jgi:hypothetical protein